VEGDHGWRVMSYTGGRDGGFVIVALSLSLLREVLL